MINKTLTGVFAGVLLGAASITSVQAENSVSANVTIASDYVWRGNTQTNDEKTVQGGFDYDSGIGITAGIWGSNVNFTSVDAIAATTTGGFNAGTAAVIATSEVDFYAAYSGEVSNIGYEVGYIAYRYPGASASDFEEIYLGGSYGAFGLTHYLGQDDATDYTEASWGETISNIDVSVSYGKADAHTVLGLGAGKSYVGLDFGFNYTSAKPTTGDTENNTVFSVSKSF